MRSIVRRDTGETYQDFLTRLAQASGIETPTRDATWRGWIGSARRRLEQRLDASARSGREDHEDEGRAHASGPQSRARGRPRHRGDRRRHPAGRRSRRHDDDSRTLPGRRAARSSQRPSRRHSRGIEEIVGDKGYHSNDRARSRGAGPPDLHQRARPGATLWVEQEAQRRGLCESSADSRRPREALCGDAGNCSNAPSRISTRRAGCGGTIRGHPNILKRLFVHAGGFNLGLWMRDLRVGTPRGLQGRLARSSARCSARCGASPGRDRADRDAAHRPA